MDLELLLQGVHRQVVPQLAEGRWDRGLPLELLQEGLVPASLALVLFLVQHPQVSVEAHLEAVLAQVQEALLLVQDSLVLVR